MPIVLFEHHKLTDHDEWMWLVMLTRANFESGQIKKPISLVWLADLAGVGYIAEIDRLW